MPPDATDAAVLGIGNVLWADVGFGVRAAEAFREAFQGPYFNNVQTPIPNTLEVADVPEVATPAAEDLEDSRTRTAHGAPRWRRCTRTSTPRSGSDPTRARWQSGRQ